jgi:hypothetical protein
MTIWTDTKMRWLHTATLALSALAVQTAQAAELCVICTEPAAIYRCDLGADVSQAGAAALQLACIKDMAARGGHKLCSVERGAAPASCAGPVIALTPNGAASVPFNSATAPVTAAAPPAGAPAPVPIAVPAAPPVPASPPGPPQTMEELAKITAEQSKKDWDKTTSKVAETTQSAGHELKKAGEAVGSVFEKSWTCVVSLFSRC